MKKEKWSIAIIDEGIDMMKIKCFFPDVKIKIHLVKNTFNYVDSDIYINHGTLCTLLLLEKLNDYNLIDYVKITCFPITQIDGKKNINEFIRVLNFCQHETFDFILISAGLRNMIFIQPILDYINKITQSIFICAQSNDLKISYPASFSSVIGVKRSDITQTEILRVIDSYDGIELKVPLQESIILDFLKKEYNLSYVNSNSILVPWVLAIVLKKIEQSKIEYVDKQSILSLFSTTVKNEADIISEEKSILVIGYTEDNLEYLKSLLKSVQNEFINNRFNTYVLTDCIMESNFDRQWLKVSSKSLNKDICQYGHVIYEGLMIVFVEEHLIKNITEEYIKYNLNFQVNKAKSVEDIANDIIEKLS